MSYLNYIIYANYMSYGNYMNYLNYISYVFKWNNLKMTWIVLNITFLFKIFLLIYTDQKPKL